MRKAEEEAAAAAAAAAQEDDEEIDFDADWSEIWFLKERFYCF